MTATLTLDAITTLNIVSIGEGFARVSGSIAIPGARARSFGIGVDTPTYSIECELGETTVAANIAKFRQIIEIAMNPWIEFHYLQFPGNENISDGFYRIEDVHPTRDFGTQFRPTFQMQLRFIGTTQDYRLATYWAAAAETYSGWSSLTANNLTTLPYNASNVAWTVTATRTTSDGSNQILLNSTRQTIAYKSSATIADWYKAEARVYDYAVRVGATTQSIAKLITHFNGNTAYATNYYGEPVAHRSQPPTISGGVIYRPGKFGKAVQIAEATTNVIANPSFEIDTTGWGIAQVGDVITRFTLNSVYGSACLQVDTSATVNAGASRNVTAETSANTQYTVSAYVLGTGATLCLWFFDDVSGARFVSTVVTNGIWKRISYTDTFGAGSTIRYIGVVTTSSQIVTFWIDAIQCEQKAYLTPYCDGSLGTGHSWLGAAHASASSRTVGRIQFPTSGNIIGSGGTIALWINPSSWLSTDYKWAFTSISGTDIIAIGIYTVNTLVRWGTDYITIANVPTADTWTHLCLTSDGTTVKYYVNGVLINSGAATTVALPTNMDVGSYAGAEANTINGLIDDFIILPSAISADEILAIYNAGTEITTEPDITMQVFDPSHVFSGNVMIDNGLMRYHVNADTNVGTWWAYNTVDTPNMWQPLGQIKTALTGNLDAPIVHLEITKISSEEIAWEEVRQNGINPIHLSWSLRRGSYFARCKLQVFGLGIDTATYARLYSGSDTTAYFAQMFNSAVNGAAGGGDLNQDATNNYECGYATTRNLVAGFALCDQPTKQPYDVAAAGHSLAQSNTWAVSTTRVFFVFGFPQDTATFVIATGRASALAIAQQALKYVTQELVLVEKGWYA